MCTFDSFIFPLNMKRDKRKFSTSSKLKNGEHFTGRYQIKMSKVTKSIVTLLASQQHFLYMGHICANI